MVQTLIAFHKIILIKVGGESMEPTMRLANYELIQVYKDIYQLPKGVELIEAIRFWEQGKKGKGVVIAVIDTGCDTNHIELKDRIIGGRNFTDEDDGDPAVYKDYNGHGTHVAGTIAANMNGIGVVGVAPEASLMILKASNRKGMAKYSSIINAIDYAVEMKVDIISLSLGGEVDDLLLHESVKKAVNKNILVVCAAANETDNGLVSPSYPADYEECISVGSVDYEKLANLIKRKEHLDLVAPGVGILSTYLNGTYAIMSGTSMAVPHVTGALALLTNYCEREFGRRLSESEIYAQLIKRTINFGYDAAQVGNGCIFLSTIELLQQCYYKTLKQIKKSNQLYEE